MARERKPWEIPISYNEDRWEQPIVADAATDDDDPEERDGRDVEALIQRGPRESRHYKGNDTAPLDYAKGPHDDEFGVETNHFDMPDADPVPYDNGPNDDEFGIDDDEDN